VAAVAATSPRAGGGRQPLPCGVPRTESLRIDPRSAAPGAPDEHPWLIGEWHVDPTLQTLQRGDELVRVPPKPLAVLLRLAREPGACVRRTVLIDEIWERQFVNDEVLSRTVAELRRYLGDSAKEPAYIQTIPKRGYRLVATVRALPAEAPTSLPATATTTAGTAPPEPGAAPARRWPVLLLAALGLLGIGLVLLAGWRGRAEDSVDEWRRRVLLAQPLTVERALVLTPRWLPGGQQLLYARIAERGSGSSQIVQRSLDGLTEHVLVDEGRLDACPLATPDGSQLIWMRHSDSGCELLQRPLLGGETIALGACWRLPGVFNCADLSADGGTLYLTAPASEGGGLLALDRTSRSRRPLTRPPAGAGFDASPRLSPDGRRLAYSRTLPNQLARLHVLDLASGVERALQDQAHANAGHDWVDPRQLLLASDSPGFRALLLVDAGGGRPRVLGARGARRPDFAGDGGLLWEATSQLANLWIRQRSDPAQGQRITHSRGFDQEATLDPDGQRLAYASTRQGREAIWVLALASGEEERLPLPADSAWRQPSWSRDGQALWLVRQRDGDSAICQYRFAGQALHCPPALTQGSQPAELPDGSLGWLRQQPGGAQLWRYWPQRAAVAPWLPGAVLRWQPQGERLLLQRPAEAEVELRLWRQPGQLQRRLPIGQPNAAWSSHAGGLVWIERDGPTQRWLSETRWDGHPQRLGPLPVEAAEISISTDGERWVVGQIDELEVDLMWAPSLR
jgi:DNA-binding winged helix-turn-helix (wHTH) protein/Tol biopolymer transport system component